MQNRNFPDSAPAWWQAAEDEYNQMNDNSVPLMVPEDAIVQPLQPPQPIMPEVIQQEAKQEAVDQDNETEDLSGPIGAGVVESGQATFNPATGGLDPIVPDAPKPETDLQKLEKKLQELRDLDAQRMEAAEKRKFNSNMIASIGEGLGKYATAGIQKNVGTQLKHQGVTSKEIMDMVGKSNIPSSKEQREQMLAMYKDAQLNKKRDDDAKLKAARDEVSDKFKERTVTAAEKNAGQRGSYEIGRASRHEESREDRVNDKIYKSTQDLQKDKIYTKLAEQGIAFEEADNILKSMKEGNEVAIGALGTKMARAMGEVGVLTDTDVQRYIEAASLYQKAKDKSGKLIAGKLSDNTVRDISKLNAKMQEGFSKKKEYLINNFVERSYQNFGKQHGLSKDQVRERFGQTAGLQPSEPDKKEDKKNPDVQDYADQYLKGDYDKAFKILKNKGEI